MSGLSGISALSGASGVFGGAGLVTPPVAGFLLWLRADLGTFQDAAMTIPAVADGDVVGGWADQSGFGNHATQGTTAQKPTLRLAQINGLPALLWDPTDDILSNALSPTRAQPETIFMVAVCDDAVLTNVHDMINSSVVNRGRVFSFPAGLRPYVTANSGVLLSNNAVAITNWIGVSIVYDGVNSVFRVNGVEVTGDVGVNVGLGYVLGNEPGGTNSLDGRIHEVIKYPGQLSAADIATTETYTRSRTAIW